MVNRVKRTIGVIILAVLFAIFLLVMQSAQPVDEPIPESALEPVEIVEPETVDPRPRCIQVVTSDELRTGERKTDWCIGNINTLKFHDPECSYLPDAVNQIALDNYDDAIEHGYVPCSFCHGGK